MRTSAGHVRIALLDELTADEAARYEAELAEIDILPEQDDFTLSPAAVLERSRQDPTRRTFAILLDRRRRAASAAVGIGVLHPQRADGAAEASLPHVLLRGFSVDARWQARGIGSAAVALAVDLARRVSPEATSMYLNVHCDNEPGIRTYERNGFRMTRQVVMGRAGHEYVMARTLR
jgi:RimJ/RimL family protein N-acetyltransferase